MRFDYKIQIIDKNTIPDYFSIHCKEESIDLYKNKLWSVEKISEYFSISRDTLSNRFKKWNVVIRKNKILSSLDINPLLEKEILIEYEKCKNLKQVSKKLDCPLYSIRTTLTKNKILCDRTQYTINNKNKLDINGNEILIDRMLGKSVTELSRKYKIPKDGMFSYLKSNSIDTSDIKLINDKKVNESLKEKILELYFKEELPMEEISKIINISQSRIGRCIKRWGLKARHKLTGTISRVERIFQTEFLENNNIKFINQFEINNRFYDFYLPEYNLLIEVQGDFWHFNPKMYKTPNKYQIAGMNRDEIKKELAERHNIPIVFIWEDDIKNHKNIVDKQLETYINK